MHTERSIDVGQPLALLVQDLPDCESLLEDLGLDYWFGWDTALSALCRQDGVDLRMAADAIARARTAGVIAPAPPSDKRSLAAILVDLLRYYATETNPALRHVLVEYERMELRGNVFPRVYQHLAWLARDLVAHIDKLDTIRRGDVDVAVDRSIAGELTLAYTDVAFHLQELQDLVRVVPETELAFRGAFRAFSRALHHHIRIGYNELLPRIVVLSRKRANPETGGRSPADSS